MSVRGRLYGETLTPAAYAEVLVRHAPTAPLRADVTAEGTQFRFTVDYGALTEGVRDLWLRPAGESGPRVRIARLLADVADKTPIFTNPKVTLRTERGRWW